eukprot:m.185620 g.185620  ORF g.185620 m.185620 type:complete len:1059 (-) comp16686_c0_seq2:245-3421(-)
MEEDVNAVIGSDTKTLDALIQATREGNQTFVRAILARDMGKRVVNRTDDEGFTALHYAARSTDPTMVQILVEGGADALAPGEEDIAPLHVAAKLCNEAVLRVLVQDLQSKNLQKKHLQKADAYGSTALHYAVMRKNEDVCAELLLSLGADVNATDEQLLTPLHIAATYGHHKSVSLLLKHGADWLAQDIDKGSPMHAAAMGGHNAVIRKLLDCAGKRSGELLEDPDSQGNTALHLAVENQHIRATNLLLRRSANTEAKNSTGSTPLHIAARGTKARIVTLLMMHHAQLNARDEDNMTPLHRAALFNRVETMEILLKANADYDATDKDGFTPLMCACWKGHVEAAKMLLDYGASLLSTDKFGKNPLLWAVEEHHIPMVELILERCASKNNRAPLRVCDRYSNSALHVAAQVGDRIITDLLLASSEREFYLAARNDEERNALHEAAIMGHASVATQLIKADSHLLEGDDYQSNKPIHLAATHGHAMFVEQMLKRGASIEARNDFRWTALDCAASRGWTEVVSVLVESGAPIDSTDNIQMTPLHLAAKSGHVEVVKYLLDAKAGLALRNNEGENALDIAVRYGQLESALAIIHHERWEQAMDNHDNNGLTPMKRMIIHMPEAALAVLKRCWSEKGGNRNDEAYTVTYNWKYIDEQQNTNFQSDVEHMPLWLMQQYNRSDLLAHPVVEALLFYKHKHFGATVYYLNFAFYALFLFFLTYFVVDVPVAIGEGPNIGGLSHAAQFIVVLFSGFRVLGEIAQMVFDRSKYFRDIVNILEWGVFTTSLGFFIPFYLDAEQTVGQWSSGAVAVFLAWVNFVVLARKLDVFGIYVLMFEETLFTVLKVQMVFFLFIVGFALSFFILFQETFYFGDIGRSLMKTFVMMTGEFEYIDYFPSQFSFETLPYFMFGLFVVIMPIILMNLLVGLAVGDIQRILDNARLNRRKMRVQDLLPLQAFMAWLRGKISCFGEHDPFYRESYVLLVNKVSFWRWLASRVITFRQQHAIVDVDRYFEKTELEKLREANNRLSRDVTKLKKKVRQLQNALDEQVILIRDICQAANVEHELD